MPMTQRRTAEMAALATPFDADKVKKFFTRARAAWATRHGEAWIASHHRGRDDMKINDGTLGYILNGKIQALPWQCLVIAHELEIALEDVLHIEGLPDVAALIDLVEHRETATEEDEGVKRYLLDNLRFAKTDREWRRLPWDSIYKERAEWALVQHSDPFARARFYADAVYEWWRHHKEDDVPRYHRKTAEMASLS